MTQKVGPVVVPLEAETGNFKADIGRAAQQLNADMTRMRRSVENLQKQFRPLAAAAQSAGAALAATFAVGGASQILKVADDYNKLVGRLDNATRSTRDLAQVQASLIATAKATGTSFQDNVEVFQRLSIGAKDLGASNQEVLKLVEIVDQLGAIGGSSTEAMQAGLMQFGQAMAAGTVRAEEFNSVVENLPMLAQRIADGMGTSIGQLRQQMLKGGLDSKQVFDALLSQSESVRAEFDRMPPTLSRAVNNMQVSLGQVIGDLDRTTGVTQTLAKELDDAANAVSQFFNDASKTGPLLAFIGTTENAANAVLELGTALGSIPGVSRLLFEPLNDLIGVFDGISSVTRIAAAEIQEFASTSGALLSGDFSAATHRGIRMRAEEARAQASAGYLYRDKLRHGGIPYTFPSDMDAFASPLDRLSGFSLGGKPMIPGPGSGARRVQPVGGGGGGGRGRRGGGRGKSPLQQQLEDDKRAAQQIYDETRTLYEKLAAEEAKLLKLRQKNLISADTYARKLKALYADAERAVVLDDPRGSLNDDIKRVIGRAFAEPEDLAEGVHLSAQANDELQRRAQILEMLQSPYDKLKEQLREVADLQQKGRLKAEQAQAAQYKMITEYGKQNKETRNDLESLSLSVQNFGRNFENAFISSLTNGKFAFKDFVASALEDLARLIFRLTVINPLVENIANGIKGSGQKSAGGFLAGLGSSILGGLLGGGGGATPLGPVASIAGKRATGGPVSAGKTYLVGEEGPELFTPGRSGGITPNDAMGGQVVKQTIIINATDAESFRAMLKREGNLIGSMGLQAVQQAENKRGRRGPLDRG